MRVICRLFATSNFATFDITKASSTKLTFFISRAAARLAGDRLYEASFIINLGVALAATSEYAAASEHYKEALLITREIGDKRGEAIVLMNLGMAQSALGDYENAIKLVYRAIEINRQNIPFESNGIELINLALLLIGRGETEKSVALYEEGLEDIKRHGDLIALQTALSNLGNAYAQTGKYSGAINLFS